MELRELATFRVVARTLSFTKAAETLNYAQSTVSAHIQTLEQELDAPLFDRLGRRIVLTEVGRRLLDYAERMADLTNQVRALAPSATQPGGYLTLSAPESVLTYRLPSLLRCFRDQYPEVRLCISAAMSAAAYADLYRNLADGVIDVAFVIEPPVQSPSLAAEKLIAEPLVLLASPDHPLAASSSITLNDLDGQTILLTERGCRYRMLFEYTLSQAGVYPHTSLDLISVEAIKQCAIAGLGLAFLPAVAVVREMREGRLVPLRWIEPDLCVYTQMVYHRERIGAPALQAFLDMAREILGASELSPEAAR